MTYEKGKDRFRIGKTYISCTNIPDAKAEITRMSKEGANGYICVSNPRTVTYATKHIDYRKVMAESLMNLPDAEPMLWAAKLWRLKDVQRTMGPVLFKEMLSEPQSGLKHFLLGDTNETLDKITQKFTSEADAIIVGSYSPPFCSLDEYDYEKIAKLINDSGADLVWISMRAPKQDFFASRIKQYLDKKICIGVGAAFRFNLGEYKMAPPIIKKLGLMGLYWGKKSQSWLAFIWGYFNDNVPYLYYLAKIPFRRLVGKKYYE